MVFVSYSPTHFMMKNDYSLLDNNNLSGYLPEELSQMQGLTILYAHSLLYSSSVLIYIYIYLEAFSVSESENPSIRLSLSFSHHLFCSHDASCSQLDNNNFEGSIIPESYGNMTKLFKL